MQELFNRLGSGLGSMFSALLPFGGDSAKSWQNKQKSLLGLRLTFFVTGMVALYVLGPLLSYRADERIQRIWLPVAGVVLLLIICLGRWIWREYQSGPASTQFPDIDMAWSVATAALAQGGIRLGDLPIFLVLGRPQEAEENLFAAARLPLVVAKTPPGPEAPVHVYATRDAIYVTCAGASLLGKHASNIALEGIDQQVSQPDDANEDGMNKTLTPGGAEENVVRVLRRGTAFTIIERRAARREAGKPISDLLNRPLEMEALQARLAYLCHLLVRDRKPLCPINGALVLIPIGGTDTDEDAQQTAELCSRDLATIRGALRLQFATLVLCCDLETLPGFRDFNQLVPPRERLGRLGQGFPRASPGLAGPDLQDKIHKSVDFICNSYLRDWVYRLFRIDAPDGQDATARNTSLFLFLNEIRERKNQLSRVLTHGIAKEATFPLLYSGCYLAGTGANGDSDQSFVAGVFKEKLMQNESKVAWSDQAFADDRRYRRLAKFLGGVLIFEVLAVAGLIALVVFKFKNHP